MADAARVRALVEEGGAQLGLALGPELVEGLVTLHQHIVRWSGRVRLVGSTDPEVMAVRHFLDSLLLLPRLTFLAEGSRLTDIGTGAGLPGLPIALARPGLEVHLVETDRRKAAFVRSAVAELGLRSVRVHSVRAEGNPAAEGVPLAEAVVSRAFTGLEGWLPLAVRYVPPGGAVLAMLGRSAPERAALVEAGKAQGLEVEEVWSGVLPGDAGERSIVRWRSTWNSEVT